jgi:hypothetical protein
MGLFPHLCGRCGREFSGTRLKELTVHHRDHDHDHNPPDGSNWELLCIYCHDHEHEKFKMKGYSPAGTDKQLSPSIFSQFEALDALIKPNNTQIASPVSRESKDDPSAKPG